MINDSLGQHILGSYLRFVELQAPLTGPGQDERVCRYMLQDERYVFVVLGLVLPCCCHVGPLFQAAFAKHVRGHTSGYGSF